MKKIIFLLSAILISAAVSFAAIDEIKAEASQALAEERYATVVRTLEPVIEAEGDKEAWWLLAQAYLGLEQDYDAERALNETIKLDRGNRDAQSALGILYVRRDNYSTAEKVLKALKNKNAQEWNYLGITYQNLSNFRGAKSSFEKAIDMDAAYVDPLVNLATLYFTAGEYADSISYLEKAQGLSDAEYIRSQLLEVRKVHFLYEAERAANKEKWQEAADFYKEYLSIVPEDNVINMTRARMLYNAENGSELLELLDHAVTINESAAEAYGLRGLWLMRTDSAAGFSNLMEAVDRNSIDGEVFNALANYYNEGNSPKRAATLYGRAIYYGLNTPEVYAARGDVLMQVVDYNGAQLAYQNAIAAGYKPAGKLKKIIQTVATYTYAVQAADAFHRGDFDEAKSQLKEAGKSGKLPELDYLAGRIALETGDIKTANKKFKAIHDGDIEDYAAALESDKDFIVVAARMEYNLRSFTNALYYYKLYLSIGGSPDELTKELALAFNRIGDELTGGGYLDSAEVSYNEALNYEPGNLDALYGLEYVALQRDRSRLAAILVDAEAEIARRNYRRALTMLTPMQEVAPDSVRLAVNIASCYYYLEDYNAALRSLNPFASAAQTNENLADIFAKVYYDADRYDDSIRYLRILEQLNPDNGETYFIYGLIFQKRNDYERAIDNFMRCIGLLPNKVEARIYLGNIYYERGWYDRCEEQYRGVLRLEPNNQAANYNLGIIYYRKNELRRALELFKTLEKTSAIAGVYYNLGRIYYYLGDIDTAYKYMNALHNGRPDNVLYKFGLGLVYAKRYQKQGGGNNRQKALELLWDCVFNNSNSQVSLGARRVILTLGADEEKLLYASRQKINVNYPPQIIDSFSYVYASDKKIYRFGAETEDIIWEYEAPVPPRTRYVIDNYVYVALMNGSLIALSLENGSKVWEYSIMADSIAAYNEVLYAVTADNKLYALSDKDELWSVKLASDSYKVENFNDILFLEGVTRLQRIDMESGKTVWSMDENDLVKFARSAFDSVPKNTRLAHVMTAGDKVIGLYVGEEKDWLVSFNIEEGDIMWMMPLEVKSGESFGISGNMLLVPHYGSVVSCYNTDDGTMKWQKDSITSGEITSMTVYKDRFYLSSDSGMIYSYNIQTGQQNWEYSVADNVEDNYYILYFRK